jgi:predicted acetyltransferase
MGLRSLIRNLNGIFCIISKKIMFIYLFGYERAHNYHKIKKRERERKRIEREKEGKKKRERERETEAMLLREKLSAYI